jgi:hypothetical protein
MKYKVIAKIMDGVIAINKNHIVCFDEDSLRDNEGDSLYHSNDGIYIGQILTEKNHSTADRYWSYTKKEWMRMNSEFEKL